MAILRIALIGERNSEVLAHQAIPLALRLAGLELEVALESTWIRTDSLETDPTEQLAVYHAIWCVPGSPYASLEGALGSIALARVSGRPFLGTCGGFQYALLEYARNVLGLTRAEHAEVAPEAEEPFIAPLSCAMVERSGPIILEPESLVGRLYGVRDVTEEYHCSYGLNPRYADRLADGPLAVVGRDERGEVRAVELRHHPFFVATLYQPERTALKGRTHPLIAGLVRAAAKVASGEVLIGGGR